MKEFKLFSYIRKYRALIVLSSLLMGALFYSYFSRKQTYTASAIIQYMNPEAVDGLAPDGTEIDVTEIYSVEVMTKVFERLGLSYDGNNIDAIRANVRVEAIQSKEEATAQEALNEKGELAEEKPTMYLVSYTVGSQDVRNAGAFSQQILKAMLNAYVETYAENHVNSAVPLYSVEGLYERDYDYIEMAEILDTAVARALDQLSYRTDAGFRSADTGYTFADLRREFALLDEISVPDAYAYILGNQVTKDQDVLISKYEDRIKNAVLKNDKSEAQWRGIDEIIAAYVEMMRGSLNTDFTHEYILGDVYDEYFGTGEDRKRADETTEYDSLMNHFVSERTAFESTLIDIAYDQYILEVYSGNVGMDDGVSIEVVEDPKEAPDLQNNAGDTDDSEKEPTDEAGEPVSDPETNDPETDDLETDDPETDDPETDDTQGTVTFIPDTVVREKIVSSQESQDTALQMLTELADRVDFLYQTAIATNQEYNRYTGAENIGIMTDTVLTPAMNLLVYAMLAVALFGVVGCVLAIVVGRTFEIFDYYIFMDRKLNIANRMGCDRYIAKYSKVILPSDFVCVSIKMTEIEEKNRRYGREVCDKMMADFCRILREVFSSDRAFLANNGLGQFIVFLEASDREQAHAYIEEIGNRSASYNKEHECKIAYTCGISVSGKSKIYEIRKLMIDSIKKASRPALRRIS